jgi:hypothetical protein
VPTRKMDVECQRVRLEPNSIALIIASAPAGQFPPARALGRGSAAQWLSADCRAPEIALRDPEVAGERIG